MPWTKRFFIAIALCLAFQVSMAGADPVEKRIGLVIGNGGYQSGALATAANDAGLIAQTLQAAGFDVVGARDLDEDSLRHAVRDFVDKVSAAGPDAVAFFYFAGYALQLEGENYLIPVDARIDRDSDVPVRGLRLYDFVVRALDSLHPRASFVVLDAARANPFAKSGQPLAGGLALIDPPAGMLIAFNAAPGTVAPDGPGPYGPYAQALAEMIREGGLPVGELFDRVRLRVNETTKGAEVPWSATNAQPPFLFFERAADAPQSPAPPAQAAAIRSQPIRDLGPQQAYISALDRDSLDGYQEFLAAYPDDPQARRVRAILAARREAIVWRRTCIADQPNAYWSYLRRYPNGPHAYDARRRLARWAAALEPPPVFPVLDYDVPPPPPEEIVFVDRPVLAFDDPMFALPPPPPPPIFLLPPPPPDFIVLAPPPPPVGLFVLPMPAYRPIPVWVRPPRYIAPPPPNNIIFANVHNTVVINPASNSVTITTPGGQPVPFQRVVPGGPGAPGRPGTPGGPGAPAQALGAAVPAAAVGPSLPPSVARRVSLTPPPGAAGPGSTAPVQSQPNAAAPTALPKPPQTGAAPAGQPAASKPNLGKPLPGGGGQPLPFSASTTPGQPAQGKPAASQTGPGAAGAAGSPPPARPRAKSGANQTATPSPGQGRQSPSSPPSQVSAPTASRQPPRQPAPPPSASPQAARPAPPAPAPQRAARPTPPPQAMRPPSPPPQAVRPPSPPPQAVRPPSPPPQAVRPPPQAQAAPPRPAPAPAARPAAPSCPPGTHFANGKCVK